MDPAHRQQAAKMASQASILHLSWTPTLIMGGNGVIINVPKQMVLTNPHYWVAVNDGAAAASEMRNQRLAQGQMHQALYFPRETERDMRNSIMNTLGTNVALLLDAMDPPNARSHMLLRERIQRTIQSYLDNTTLQKNEDPELGGDDQSRFEISCYPEPGVPVTVTHIDGAPLFDQHWTPTWIGSGPSPNEPRLYLTAGPTGPDIVYVNTSLVRMAPEYLPLHIQETGSGTRQEIFGQATSGLLCELNCTLNVCLRHLTEQYDPVQTGRSFPQWFAEQTPQMLEILDTLRTEFIQRFAEFRITELPHGPQSTSTAVPNNIYFHSNGDPFGVWCSDYPVSLC